MLNKKTKITVWSLLCAGVLGATGVSAYIGLQSPESDKSKETVEQLSEKPKEDSKAIIEGYKGTKNKEDKQQEKVIEPFKQGNESYRKPIYQEERKLAYADLSKKMNEEQAEKAKKEAESEEIKGNPEEIKPIFPTLPEEPTKPTKPVDPPAPPVVVETNYEGLASLYEGALGISTSRYLTRTVTPFLNELRASERMLTDLDSSQGQVDHQIARLQASIDGLVLKGNKATLNVLLMACKQVDKEIYSDETIAHLEAVITEAEGIQQDEEVSQEQVDQSVQSLNAAMEGLVAKEEPLLSLVYLERKVAEIEKLDLTMYTAASVQNLKNEQIVVQAYIEAGNYTKAENETLLNSLSQAIEQLQKKGDTKKIVALLEAISALEREQYTAESLGKLDLVVDHVKNELTNENLIQDEVNVLYDSLNEAYQGLILNE